MSDMYDLIVIGGGPAGYPCAIRAAQLGLNVACIDDWQKPDGKASLGGTCVNVGCIPSKALLESSEQFAKTQHEFIEHGITAKGVSMDVGKMQTRKQGIVDSLTGGVESLFKANKVTFLHGRGKLLGNDSVEFTPHKGKAETLGAKNIVLAAGSVPVDIPVARADGERIVDSAGALEFDKVPKRLGVIGGGVIGLELGSVWRRLGAEVVVIEALEDFLAIADRAIARDAQRVFKKQGLDIRLGARVTGTKTTKTQVTVEYEDKKGTHSEKFDKVVVCVGRRPNTAGLSSAEAGLELDERGFVDINHEWRTSLPNVYAIGDLVRGPMLAHKGTEEGIAVAELIGTGHGHVNYDAVPSVIYTWPEIAWVGQTEEEVKSAGIEYRTGSVPFAANGRAKAMEAAVGQVKMIADAKTDRILGVHIIGPMASELIAEAVLAMEYGASSEDIARTMHAHPGLGEMMHEAALSVDKRAIHAINKR